MSGSTTSPLSLESHTTLFAKDIPGVESVGGELDLVTGRRCLISCAPVKHVNGDAFPVRVLASPLEEGGRGVDVRTIEACAPRLEHEESTRVWWLSDVRELFDETTGGRLESVAECEVTAAPGVGSAGLPGYRFWYVVSGRGRVAIGGETGQVAPGDLVVIPPGAAHRLEPATANAPVRCLGFAVTPADALPHPGGGPAGAGPAGGGPAAAITTTGHGLDVRSVQDVVPESAPDGSARTWWLVAPGEFDAATTGGFLELIDEFEVVGGGEVHPHAHPTWEFYYGLFGRGRMTISGVTQVIGPGDLVAIPPDAVHSIGPVGPHTGIRCFCFAVGLPGAAAYDYSGDQAAGALAS